MVGCTDSVPPLAVWDPTDMLEAFLDGIQDLLVETAPLSPHVTGRLPRGPL